MLLGGKNPGPNAYNEQSKMSVMKQGPRYGFGGMEQRPATAEMRKKVPGPGSYAARSTLDGRGKSLAKRLPGPKSTADLVPGPGSYN